jgi:hypothetical protein
MALYTVRAVLHGRSGEVWEDAEGEFHLSQSSSGIIPAAPAPRVGGGFSPWGELAEGKVRRTDRKRTQGDRLQRNTQRRRSPALLIPRPSDRDETSRLGLVPFSGESDVDFRSSTLP